MVVILCRIRVTICHVGKDRTGAPPPPPALVSVRTSTLSSPTLPVALHKRIRRTITSSLLLLISIVASCFTTLTEKIYAYNPYLILLAIAVCAGVCHLI